MKIIWVCFLFVFLLLIPSVVLAESPYGSMDVYYNDKLLPGKETAKPILKIEEPFKVKINLTVYQKLTFTSLYRAWKRIRSKL